MPAGIHSHYDALNSYFWHSGLGTWTRFAWPGILINYDSKAAVRNMWILNGHANIIVAHQWIANVALKNS
jgi:hypothetical protein